MRRKKHNDEHENHERWLVSYADLMTLLFAFFVVMYAISSINERKFKTLSDSIAGALTGHPATTALVITGTPAMTIKPNVKIIPPGPYVSEERQREKKHMTHLAKNIMEVLAPLVKEGKVRVTQSPKGVTVEINASVLFGPGDASLSAESLQALRAVAAVLVDDTHKIIVEGHTDITPINTVAFASNWELSSARASRVVRLFSEVGVAEQRLVASGRGSTVPVSDNTTNEGRANNRRVSIMILSEENGEQEIPLN